MRPPRPLRRIPSILMERQDPILVGYERRLRRHFASTGFPEIWISPTVQAKPDHLDSRALLHMFHGWHLGQSGKAEDVVEFRESMRPPKLPT